MNRTQPLLLLGFVVEERGEGREEAMVAELEGEVVKSRREVLVLVKEVLGKGYLARVEGFSQQAQIIVGTKHTLVFVKQLQQMAQFGDVTSKVGDALCARLVEFHLPGLGLKP